MSKFKEGSLIKNPYFWIIFSSLVVAMLVIFVSPYLFESFASLLLRLFVASLILFGTLLSVLVYALFVKEEMKQKLREAVVHLKRKKKYSEGVKEKVQDLKTRFNEALRIVKSSSIYKNSQQAGYELPWYLVVGAEDEGKSVVLEHSGLDFPLNINYDKKTQEQQEGAKPFEWYFAEDAIFIDMPGRHISHQDSEEDVALWESFLKLFSKKRWKRPINGIILTVSVDTLVQKDDKELEQYAKDLRDRFDDIAGAFKSNIPIYLVITKTDKVFGFQEYFANLSNEEKDEVLGVTFEEGMENIDSEVIEPELEALLERLNSVILDKMNKEWDPDARAKILLFPKEIGDLFKRLNKFVEISFSQTRYRKPLMLRGVYFTAVPSSNALTASQEFEESSLATVDATQAQKGMFIKKLFSNIVFPEADIIKMDTSYKKNQRVRQIAAVALSVGIVAIATIFWIGDFNNRLDALSDTEKGLLQYDKMRSNMDIKDDFEKILPALNQMKKLADANKQDMHNKFYKIAYYKVEDRNRIIQQHYEQALREVLLPRIARFMEEQIAANADEYDLTWESTKAYSMLKNEQHRDPDFLRAWMATGWSHLYPNKSAIQNDLNMHFANLLKYGFKPYKLDENTLKIARAQLLQYGPEALVYKELKDEAKEKNLNDFRFSNVLGSYASAFEGSDYIIPGFYTKKGFEQIIIKDGKPLIKKLVANNWVVGYSTDLSDAELNEMYAKVLNYYFIDYKKYWAEALSSLKIPTYKSISEINNQLTVLTSGTSPIIGVLQALKENTLIYTPAEKLQMKADEKLKTGKMASIASKNAIEKAKKQITSTSVKNVREYFAVYNSLLDKNNQPTSKLSSAMFKLNTVYQEMTSIYGSVTPEKDAYKIVINRIEGKHAPIIMPISSLPRPVDKWFKKALKNDWEYLLTQTKRYINHQYKQDVVNYYRDKIAGRYPMVKKSRRNDVRVQDFEEFFKRDGILDGFYQTYIATFVNFDTKRNKYEYRTIDGSNVYISKNFMNAIITARDIRRILFDSKGDVLHTQFYLKPHNLSRNLSAMRLYYNEHYIGYEHGPLKSTKVTWPDESFNNVAKFSMYDLQNNNVMENVQEGEWALFKLIDTFNHINYKANWGSSSLVIDYKYKRYDGSFTLTGDVTKIFTRRNPLTHFKLQGLL